MKLEININEDKILELAQTASMDELPRSIFYEAKKQAIEVAVNEIKSKLVEKSYYSGKEALYQEVANFLYTQISEIIKGQIETKFNQKSIETIIERHFEKTFNSWIEKKIYERLEEAKKDILICSTNELKAEREAEEEAHQAELEELKERS